MPIQSFGSVWRSVSNYFGLDSVQRQGSPLPTQSTAVCGCSQITRTSPYSFELDLSGNKLGPVACRHMAEFLPDCRRLRKLNMSENGCDEEAMVGGIATSFSGCALQILLFGGGGGDTAHSGGGEIRNVGACALFNSLLASPENALSVLHLPMQGIRDEALGVVVDWMAGPRALELSLEANRISAEGAAKLLAAAAQCVRLFTLNLSRNRLKGLHSLLPGRLKTQDKSLSKIQGIAKLFMAGANLEEEDVLALARALYSLKGLRLLDINSNPGAHASFDWPFYAALRR